VEQQLEKEREARMLMRDRLRHTEALAAESHALRSAMAQELEKVTADRDRLRAEAATAGAASTASATTAEGPSFGASAAPAEPSMTFVPPPREDRPPPASSVGERPLAPPTVRRGPWRALAMLGGLAVGVAFLAWLNGSMPSVSELAGAASSPMAASQDAARREPPAARTEEPSASVALAAAAPPPASVALASAPSGPVALPPLAPEAQLAVAPAAAGPAPSASVAAVAAPLDLAPRLRKALDGEGISAPVAVDAASGHVVVSDPRPDPALRDRTDMLIRAVYAGASLPEPQIEHRWLTPKRGEQVTSMSPILSTPASAPVSATAPAPGSALSPAAAYLARHPLATSAALSTHAADRAKKPAGLSVADAEELRPVLPAGHLTASCMDGLAGKTSGRRALLTACMKHSCCSSAANLNSEECRAYTKAYPFTCSAG
jgi:hypothetical protein